MPILDPPIETEWAAEPHAPLKPGHTWRVNLGNALRGWKLGIRGHSSFFVHFFFAALVLAAAVVLRCGVIEWCLLVGCIGMVLTAELVNSAIQTIFLGLDEETRQRTHTCLDIAASAVLLTCLCAVLIGGAVFLHKISALVFQ